MPIGIGVTALSEADAFALIKEQGYDKWFEGAKEISVKIGLVLSDIPAAISAGNVGSLRFRGVWYPVANIGFGSPKDREYKGSD